MAEFKFESKVKPLPVTPEGRKANEIWVAKSALGAQLRHSSGWFDGRAQTQSVSKSVTVASGSNWLALGKIATTLEW